MKTKLTQEYLKECLEYNPETGVFTWVERPLYHFKDCNKFTANHWYGRCLGKTAGYINPLGYNVIVLNGKAYLGHRLAFLYMEGYIPENIVDHIDMDPKNNKWNNLREASNQCNQQNRKISVRNTSGVTGVSWAMSQNKWRAKITISNKTMVLGYFERFDDAVAARYDEERTNPLWTCSVASSAKRYLISIGELV